MNKHQVKKYYNRTVHLTRKEAYEIMEKGFFKAVYYYDNNGVVHVLQLMNVGMMDRLL